MSVNAEDFKDKYLPTQWTTENGLPQNSVSAIEQTPDGYLWLGTFGGVARFDGVRFRLYTTANTPEIRSNRISALAVDRQGELWIGTERGEIISYKAGKFTLIDDGKETANVAISELYADNNGFVWVGSRNRLRICEKNKCKNTEFESGVGQIRKDVEGTIWLLSHFKLFKIENGKYIHDEKIKENVIAIEPHPESGVWIIKNEEFGIYRNDEYKIQGKFPNSIGYVGTNVAPDGTLMISFNKFIYQVKEGLFDNYKRYEIKNISGITSRKIFVDQEGIIWSGRVGDGLIRLLNRRVQTLMIESDFPLTPVNSIAEDFDKSIWLATNQGLFKWKNGNIIKISKEKKFENYARGSVLIDDDGKLWNGTSEGLQSFSKGKFTLHKDISWEKAQSSNSLFEDSRKNLWYGCDGCGVFVSDKEKLIAKYSTENGLVENVVNVIHESPDGSMWFGTRGGISCLKDGKFTNYKNENGLSNEYIRDIYEEADGTFWFGTYGGGLNRFKDGKFTSITAKDGLFDDIVSRILVDDEDNFWLLGNRGIYSVSRKMLNDFADGNINQVYCAAYTTADGMQVSEGNGGYQGAGLKTHDGKLWFPMINGVVIIDPKQEKLPPPKPVIEEVILNGSQIDISNKVEINPGNESLEINYTGINFRKPEQIRFRYRLAGLDEKWTEAGLRRLANYPYLPSGNYRFQLTAANADGIWSETIAEFEIIVHPPFWKTWWFLVMVGVLGFIAVMSANLYRNRRFARTRLLQEEYTRKLLNTQESERRRIASDIHDNLGQQLLVIKNWAHYCLSKISEKDKLRRQIEQIDETAAQVLDEVRAMAKNLSPYHLDKAGLTNTVIYMVKQVAESDGIELEMKFDDIDDFLPKEDEIYLYRIIQEAMNNVVKHSEAEKVSVSAVVKENKLKVQIKDNGKGFKFYQGESENFGHGLSGMVKRAEMMSGNLNIVSAKGKGTLIALELYKAKDRISER